MTATLGEADGLVDPRGVQIQFRYGFVVDKDGLKVIDVTELDKPRMVKGARVPFTDARNLYVARTYAFVAAGHDGVVIVDVERPEHPSLEQMFNDGGKIDDTNDVKIGMTNASQFAYIADGHNGLQVVQIFSPSDNPNYLGFSPQPTPTRIAQYPMHRRWSCRKGSIAIAPSTRRATSSPSSAGAARGRSRKRKWSGSTCATGRSSPSQPRRRQHRLPIAASWRL